MSTLATIRSGIKTAVGSGGTITAGGYSLTVARTVLGYVPIASGTEFLSALISSGPYLLIRGGACTDNDEINDTYTYEVKMSLYFGLANASQDNETNIEAMCEAIKALLRGAAFTAAPKPKVTWEFPEIDTAVGPALGTYKFLVRVEGCG